MRDLCFNPTSPKKHPIKSLNLSDLFSHLVVVVFQSLSPTLCDPMDCNMPGAPVLHYLLEFVRCMSIESVMLSNCFIFCHSLLLLPSIFPSIGLFPNQWALQIRWPKYLSFSFIISPSNEYSGLISFRIDSFDLLTVQGTLQESSPGPQFEGINSLAFSLFYVQLSRPYMTTEKPLL